LRQATDDLQIVTGSIAVPVTRCGRDLRYRWVNQPYAAWLHLPVDQIVERPIADVLGPAAFERLRPRFEEVLSGTVVRFEEQIEIQGIGRRWVSAVYTPTPGADGTPDGWVAVVNDVTDRRRLEESLRHSEEQLRRSLRAGRMGCFTWDIASDVVTGDAAHRKMWGFDPDVVLTRKQIFERIHPDDVARIEREEQETRGGAKHEIEFRINLPGGEVRWLAGYTEVVRGADGTPSQLIGMNADITERKEAEESLRKRERDFRSLADNTPALVARFDRNLRHLFVNRQLELATGIPAAAYLGKSNREMGIAEELCAAGDERIRGVLDTGQTATLQYTYPSATGTRHFHSWFGPELGPGGGVESVLCITREVTDQKALEIELQRRVTDLADADRRKDEFIAMLGHELRNPLSPIRNAVHVLQEVGSREPVARSARDIIDRQAAHLARLVDDLLDV
jgi:PAS domain S-box-containing protein